MKIKKLFGLATVASLAILMTACGETKNETIIDADFFNQKAISLEDYNKKTSVKKSIVELSGKISKYDNENGIYIGYDDNYYYFYNLNKNGEEILKLDSTDITYITTSSDCNCIIVRYDYNDDHDYGYAYYDFAGNPIIEKTYMTGRSVNEVDMYYYIDSATTATAITEYELTYTVKEDGFYQNKAIYYYLVQKASFISGDITETKFINEEEFIRDYSNRSEGYQDGTIYGLKGYQVKAAQDGIYIFKNEKFVNRASIYATNLVISDGYALFQSVKNVTINDKYDLAYNGSYLKVSTYKMNLLDSKVTEVKDFHYYIVGNESAIVENEKIDSYVVDVIDYKGKDITSSNDIRLALVKGNGKIKVHEAMAEMGGTVISSNNTYYVYKEAQLPSESESTIVYDKKGNVKQAYNGIYFNDVLAKKTSSNKMEFVDKTGKTAFVLNDYQRLSYGKYLGKNILDQNVLVELTNGEVVVTEIGVLYVNQFNLVFTNVSDSNVRSFYAMTSTLDTFEFTCSGDDYVYELSNGIYYVQYDSGIKLIRFE